MESRHVSHDGVRPISVARQTDDRASCRVLFDLRLSALAWGRSHLCPSLVCQSCACVRRNTPREHARCGHLERWWGIGTRADFYVGRGETAQWLGSIAFDGFPEAHAARLIGCAEESAYRLAVQTLLAAVDHATRPAQGWPWPWPNSQTTDFAYAWDAGVVYVTCFGHGWQVLRAALDDWPDDATKVPFPDMTVQQRVTVGRRSGVILVTRTGIVDDEPLDAGEGKT